jgi:hypothetical protein
LFVDPFGRIGVSDDVHVLLEFFVSDGAALVKQLLYLGKDEGVAFGRGGMGCFLRKQVATPHRK